MFNDTASTSPLPLYVGKVVPVHGIGIDSHPHLGEIMDLPVRNGLMKALSPRLHVGY